MDNVMLVRTNNKIKDVTLGLLELGFTELKDVNSNYIPDTLFVSISDKTFTVVNSTGFIEASRNGKLSKYQNFADGGELLTYVKEFVVTEPKPEETPLAAPKPKRSTRKKKTETKKETTND